MKMRNRLTLLVAVGALGCARTHQRGERDVGSAMDASSTMRDARVLPDSFAFTDVYALRDVPMLPDASMDDVFTEPDSPPAAMDDVFSRPDVLFPDAAIFTDTPSLDAPLAMRDASSAGCGDLRLYFRFEETSGIVIDESGCGNHGTAIDVRRGEVGARGNAYGFGLPATRESRVEVPDSASLRALPQMTVSAWVRDQRGSSSSFVAFMGEDGWQGFSFNLDGDRAPYVDLSSGRSCSYVGQVGTERPVEIDRWTHVAVSVDPAAGEVVHYMDGIEIHREPVDSLRPPLCNNGRPLWVGAALRLAGRIHSWNGSIDELRIWSVVRTQREICIDAGGVPGAGGSCAL